MGALGAVHGECFTGEVAELVEGARLLSECALNRGTVGSNPTLSAIP